MLYWCITSELYQLHFRIKLNAVFSSDKLCKFQSRSTQESRWPLGGAMWQGPKKHSSTKFYYGKIHLINTFFIVLPPEHSSLKPDRFLLQYVDMQGPTAPIVLQLKAFNKSQLLYFFSDHWQMLGKPILSHGINKEREVMHVRCVSSSLCMVCFDCSFYFLIFPRLNH